MLQGQCAQCGSKDALGKFKSVNDKLYCARCTEQLTAGAKLSKETLTVATVIDPTVCSQCNADNGSQELRRTGNLPYCSKCEAALRERPFPSWLKLSLAGLTALLVYAQVHGIPYFKAGKNLVVAERQIGQRHYAEAIPPLQNTLAIAPDCEKCILLLSKAELLTGGYVEATKLLTGHNDGNYESGELADEVIQIKNRADKAWGKAAEADKLHKAEKFEETMRTIQEAAAIYPESTDLAKRAQFMAAVIEAEKFYKAGKYEEAAASMRATASRMPPDPNVEAAVHEFEGVAAFYRKDYDKFLDIAETDWKSNQKNADFAEGVASALACKYAATGDQNYRKRAEEMLNKARELSPPTPEARAEETAFEERTLYRLKTRQIIDRVEYNRRFGKKKSGT